MLLACGCATTNQTPVQKDLNPGGAVAGGCLRASLEFLRAGPVGIPFTLGIPVFCLPLAAAAGVLHEVVPASPRGYVATQYSPTVLPKLTDEERSVFPKTSASGCIRDGC